MPEERRFTIRSSQQRPINSNHARQKTERDERRTPIESTAGRIRITYREDDAPVGDGSPEVGRLGAHWAVQERLERRRHGGQAETRPRSPWTVEEEDWLGTIPRSGWSS